MASEPACSNKPGGASVDVTPAVGDEVLDVEGVVEVVAVAQTLGDDPVGPKGSISSRRLWSSSSHSELLFQRIRYDRLDLLS